MASGTPQPAASYQPFPAPVLTLPLEVVRIRHPGYPEPNNVLLTFSKSDRSSEGTFGVHHQTVVVACQIIAGNAFNTGYLTIDRECQHRVRTPPHGILDKGHYYFTLGPGSLDQYHIVASFQDWEFPDELPDSWPQVPPSEWSDSGGRCCVTNLISALEYTHLVPRHERRWYANNWMNRCAPPRLAGNINKDANRCWLSKNLHSVFDMRGFAIVPKVAPGATSAQYVTHFLSTDIGADLWPTYHNVAVQRLNRFSRPFLFARFAWAIFLSVKGFIVSDADRNVIQRVVELGQGGTVRRYEKVDQKSAESLEQEYAGGGWTSSRQKGLKRKRQSVETDDSTDSYTDGDSSKGSQSEDDTEKEYTTWSAVKRARRIRDASEETRLAITPNLPADVTTAI